VGPQPRNAEEGDVPTLFRAYTTYIRPLLVSKNTTLLYGHLHLNVTYVTLKKYNENLLNACQAIVNIAMPNAEGT